MPKTYGLPFAFNDPEEINRYLHQAGFIDIKIERVIKEAKSVTTRDAATGLTRGSSLYNEIISKDPSLVDRIIEETENELKEKYGDAPMIAPMSAVVCEGRA